MCMKQTCRFGLGLFLLFSFTFLYSIVPYHNTPDWSSQDATNYSTGCAWADINQDGWQDLIISNGNDMNREHLVVYLNSATGLSDSISWHSEDIDYHGHLDVGDVNSDGFPDVVVSVYIGPSGFAEKGRVKLYLNNNGTLSSLPTWTSADSSYTFSCKLADLNLDAKLDLIIATGESYYNHPDYNKIYMNIGGMFEDLPSWTGERLDCTYDVNVADFDGNGFPDIAFVSNDLSNQIYYNVNGVISMLSGWNSQDNPRSANSLSIGDVNHDGWLDLAVSDNNQLNSNGGYKVYLNENGIMQSNPEWLSDYYQYASGIELFDINNDGYEDMITGGWWQDVRIFMSQNDSLFDFIPDFQTNTSSVVERIAIIDANQDGIQNTNYVFEADNLRRFFVLPHKQLNALSEIQVNNRVMNLNEYCYDLENGYVSFANVPSIDSVYTISYTYSTKKDFAVSNWGNYSNYVFYYQEITGNNDTPAFYSPAVSLKLYPNPLSISQGGILTAQLKNVTDKEGIMSLYNIKGQKVLSFPIYNLTKKEYTLSLKNKIIFSDLSNGIYLINFCSKNHTITQKVIVLK